MKPRPRMRKAIKWTSAVMVVVLTLAWAVSLTCSVGCASGSWFVGTFYHGMEIAHRKADFPFEIRTEALPLADVVERTWFARKNLWEFWHADDWQLSIYVPFWLPIAILGGLFVRLHRADLQARLAALATCCTKCGYDRAGLAGGVACPECGALPPTPAPPPPRPASSS